MFLQNLIIRFMASIHPAIGHNIAKIEVIKKAFHQAGTEQLEGGYFEFGVYEGSSLFSALTIHRNLTSRKMGSFYQKKIARNFYGFDSFDEGFKYSDVDDKHPFFKEGDFVSSYKKVDRRLKGFNNVKLIQGYFEDTVQGKKFGEMFPNEKCAVLFIDCDLTNPAFIALDFMRPSLQKGTIIILDDYFAYGGDTKRGTYGALARFQEKYPEIKLREFFPYGYNGLSFIIFDC